MRRRMVLVVGAVAALTLAVIVAGLIARGMLWRRAPAPPPPVTALALNAPAEVAAGNPLTVSVTASPPVSGTEVLLAAQTTSGLYAASAVLQDGAAQFVLPRSWTQSAGLATLRALADGREDTAAVAIRAGAAANPLLTLTGPASVPVDGDEAPALVALPLDALGNPAADAAGDAAGGAAPVEVRVQPPSLAGGGLPDVLLRTPVQNLLAAVRLGTGKVAGILAAAAASGAARSLQQSVRVTPAELPRLVLHAAPAIAPADGAAAVALETELLADAYGNVLPDGVGVFFVAESSDGSRRWLPSVTVSGRAGAQLTAPLAPSTVTVRALVGEAASAPITVTFTPSAAAGFDLRVTVEEDAVTLLAGPLLTDLGALAADGTVVTFVISGAGGEQITRAAVTQYGFAALTLYAGSLPPAAYTVTAQAGDRRGEAAFVMPGGAP